MSDRSTAIKGGFWTSMSTAATMFSQLFRVIILTRFLEKSDFGIVAMAHVVIGLCLAFSDLGFASVIMYKQSLTKREFNGLYWMQFIIYSLFYLGVSLCTPLIASFYEEPILNTVVPLSALSMVLLAIGKLYESVLQKRYEFKLLSIRNIITNVLSLGLAWYLAWQGYGVYSLVYSTLFQTLTYNIWSLVCGWKYQPLGLKFKFREVLPMMKIGIYQTGTRVLDYISSQLDNLVIGKFLGSETLGVYDLAKNLIYRLVSFIRSVVGQVALPMLSNVNQNDDAVKNRFLLVTKVVAYMCFPACVVVAVFSNDIVHIIYGEKFLEAAPIVAIYSITSMFGCVSSFFDMLGIAKGRTDLNFKSTIFRILISTPVIFIFCHYSILALALGLLFVTFIMFPIFWSVVVNQTYPMPFATYFKQFDKLLFLLLCVGIPCYLMVNIFKISLFDNFVVNFVAYLLIFAIIIIIASWMFIRNDLFFLYELIFKKRMK